MRKIGGKQGRAKRARRQFTDELKAGAVRLVLDEKKIVAVVARDLDLTPSVLSGWVKQARADRDGGQSGLTTEERAELAALRKHMRELKMERDLRKMCLLRQGKRVRYRASCGCARGSACRRPGSTHGASVLRRCARRRTRS